MTEKDAEMVSSILGGDPHKFSDRMWVVKLKGADDRVVVIFDNFICEFENEEFFEESNATTTLALY